MQYGCQKWKEHDVISKDLYGWVFLATILYHHLFFMIDTVTWPCPAKILFVGFSLNVKVYVFEVILIGPLMFCIFAIFCAQKYIVKKVKPLEKYVGWESEGDILKM